MNANPRRAMPAGISNSRMRLFGLSVCFVLLVSFAPSTPPSLDAAHRLFVLEDFETALLSYRQIADSDVDPSIKAEALYLAGRCLQALERWDEAIRTYEEVHEIWPDTEWDTLALLKKGDCHSELANWQNALDAYQKALEDPVEPHLENQLRLNRATVLANPDFTGNDPDQAQEDFLHVAANGRTQLAVPANFGLGELERRRGNLEQANYYWNQVSNQDTSIVWRNSAKSLQAGLNELMGQPDVALEQYQTVAKDKNSPPAIREIVQQRVQTIQRQAAEPSIRATADRVQETATGRRLTGNVKVELSTSTAECSEAVYNSRFNTLTCEGNVALRIEESWSIRADRLIFNLASTSVHFEQNDVSPVQSQR